MQTEFGPLMAGFGGVFITTVTASVVPTQPLVSVTVTW